MHQVLCLYTKFVKMMAPCKVSKPLKKRQFQLQKIIHSQDMKTQHIKFFNSESKTKVILLLPYMT